LSSSLNPETGFESSPLLARAIVGTQVAQARLKQEKAKFYPKIVAVASAGEMANVRLVSRKDYAAGIGVIVPIVDFRTSGEIQRAKAVAFAQEQEVEAQKQYLGEENAKYNEIIKSSDVKLTHLKYEYELANKAFTAAKKRYFSLEGDLIDLREAWRNLSRVETEVDQTRAQMLQASGAKALLNGGGG
jgi:outer membrane protein TolC